MFRENSQAKNCRLWHILATSFVLGLFLSGCGTQEKKVYQIGILSGLEFFADTADGFKEQMTELGYIEGENVVYDLHKTNFDLDAERAILEKFVEDKVDLIVVFPTEPALAAKAATQGTNIPVLFINSNIEGVGLVDSVIEPGGNITGVRFPGPDLTVKRFEVMHELVPDARRLWLPYQKDIEIIPSQLEALRPVADAAGVTLIEAPVADAAEIDAKLQALAESADIGIDAILLMAEPLAVTPEAFAVLAKFAAEHDLPLGGALISAGGYETLFGVATDNISTGKQAALLADKILKGTPAGTIRVASAENFLSINYREALRLGIKVPDGLLAQANEIVR